MSWWDVRENEAYSGEPDCTMNIDADTLLELVAKLQIVHRQLDKEPVYVIMNGNDYARLRLECSDYKYQNINYRPDTVLGMKIVIADVTDVTLGFGVN